MKKILCIIVSFCILISLLPVISFATEAILGTEENPIVINNENPFVFFEAENYPVVNSEASNYQTVSDSNASGGYSVKQLNALAYDELSTKGDVAQYRLWINSKNEGKIKIFLRVRVDGQGQAAKISCAKNDDPLMDRSHYIEAPSKYYWVCSDSYEVEANETFSFSLVFNAGRTYIDKFMITSDVQAFPQGVDAISNDIDLSYGKDYYNAPAYNPINEHPRLLINSENINKIRTNLTGDENIYAYNSLLEDANAELTDYRFQSSTAYILSNAFCALSFIKSASIIIKHFLFDIVGFK